MKNNAPAFQWYAKEWLSSARVATMDDAQRQWYFQLLNYAWLADPPCKLPDDEQHLQELVKAKPAEIGISSQDLNAKFTVLVAEQAAGLTENLTDALKLAGVDDDKISLVLRMVVANATHSLGDSLATLAIATISDARLRAQRAFDRRWAQVMACFSVENGYRINTRLMEVYDAMMDKRENNRVAGKAGGLQRAENARLASDATVSLQRKSSEAQAKVKRLASEALANPSSASASASREEETPLESVGQRKSGDKRGTRIRADWKPADEKKLREFQELEAPDVDFDRTVLEFIDHWITVPGKAGLKLDWDATFRNRLRDRQARIDAQNKSAPTLAEQIRQRQQERDAAEAAALQATVPSGNGNEADHNMDIFTDCLMQEEAHD
jgi:hypothetical protein